MFLLVYRKMFVRLSQAVLMADYKCHLVIALLLRLIFIVYGIYHDDKYVVQYTDVDYKVYTDAARHIINNKSPYDTHTYRYTPLIAIILIPNILVHHTFGKILFSVLDVIVGLLIRTIVKSSVGEYEYFKCKNKNKMHHIEKNIKVVEAVNNRHVVQERQWNKKHKVRQHKKVKLEKCKPMNETDITATFSMLLWLYNPMTIAIATRGNCDSIAGLFVLATLYYLQCKKAYFTTGLIHGVSIHTRLYPMAYSLALFMHLSKYSIYSIGDSIKPKFKAIKSYENDSNEKNKVTHMLKENRSKTKTICNRHYLFYLVPNIEQLRLISGCLTSIVCVCSLFYFMYGYKFLYETYIYHLVRKDTRHNFSVYFYLQYLSAGVKNIGLWQKVLMVLPQLVLLIDLSVRYGLNKFSLNFSILTQTIVMVTFNTVLTSQYFVWIMAVLPLCWWQIEMSLPTALFWIITWILAQGAWLLPAYFLEFYGRNTFLLIWIQGVAFFCANIAILGRLLMNFMPRRKDKLM